MSNEKATALEIEEGSSLHLEHGDARPHRPRVAGTVRLLAHDQLILLPTPTADPKDPLNLPVWQKYVIMITIACCMFALL